MDVQVLLCGLYRPPLSRYPLPVPPHTSMTSSAQTAVWETLASGTFVVDVSCHPPLFGL
jgi:hypothetical protein